MEDDADSGEVIDGLGSAVTYNYYMIIFWEKDTAVYIYINSV